MKEYSPENVDQEVGKMLQAQKVPNILICGQTGVGKSSIVNYLFNETVAVSGDNGEPCTRGITLFRNDTVNIYDSEGYEIGGEKQAHYERLISFSLNRMKEKNRVKSADWLGTQADVLFIDRDVLQHTEKDYILLAAIALSRF